MKKPAPKKPPKKPKKPKRIVPVPPVVVPVPGHHHKAHKHPVHRHHRAHKHPAKPVPIPLRVPVHHKHPKARKLAVPPAMPGITPFASRGRLDGPGASLADWDACTAIALGASLRLAGWPVTDADVLALHVAAGGSQDVGVSILAALETAARVGLAGVRLRGFWWSPPPAHPGPFVPSFGDTFALHGFEFGANFGEWPAEPHGQVVGGMPAASPRPRLEDQFAGGGFGHGLIVGAELPGPHALTVDGPGVWSWGQWHPWGDFPGAVIEEAWTVTWQ